MAPMVESQPISQEELFNAYAERSAIAEANAYKTVPTGEYQIQVTKAEPRRYPDRDLMHCTASLSKDGMKRGTVFFDASWQSKRGPKGYLDSTSKLWNNILKALNPTFTEEQLAAVSAKDVYDNITKYPLMAFVTESFKTPSGWDTPKTEQAVAEYRSKGYRVANFVQSISKA